MAGRVIVTRETDSGRNEQFRDTVTGRTITRSQFVHQIEQGSYEHYHVREIKGVKTPASNPDRSENNNLG
jgi:hypothetical protein